MPASAPVVCGLNDPALADALERNQWEFIRGFAAVSGVEVVDDDQTLRVATGVPSPLFNPVLRATVPPTEISEVVNGVRDWYRRRRLPWSWYIGPASSPPTLGRELERRGFAKVTEPPGMAAPLDDLDALDAGAPIPIERVADRRLVDAWFAVFGPAFELSKAASSAFRDLILASGLGDDAPMRSYVALEGRDVVATGSLVIAAGVGGIYNVACRPDRRGRGIGRAMTHALMGEAVALGQRVAVLWSTTAGLPVYRKLGFEECIRVPTYLGPGR